MKNVIVILSRNAKYFCVRPNSTKTDFYDRIIDCLWLRTTFKKKNLKSQIVFSRLHYSTDVFLRKIVTVYFILNLKYIVNLLYCTFHKYCFISPPHQGRCVIINKNIVYYTVNAFLAGRCVKIIFLKFQYNFDSAT